MEYITTNEGSGANAPSFSYWPTLAPDELWVVGFEGKYAVSEAGDFISFAQSSRKLLKTCVKGGYKVVQVYLTPINFSTPMSKSGVGIGPTYWKIGDVVAEAFLGTDEYIFIDGNRANPRLENLRTKIDALLPGEAWVEGYENMYSYYNGCVYSYKRNIKRPLKLSDSLCKSKRVSLTLGSEQITMYVDKIKRGIMKLH